MLISNFCMPFNAYFLVFRGYKCFEKPSPKLENLILLLQSDVFS